MEQNVANDEKLYYFLLCKEKRYKIDEIGRIDGDYVVKIGTHPVGVILFTVNHYYKFDFTMQEGHLLCIFKERFDLENKVAKETLKNLEPLYPKGLSYTYSEKKNIRLAYGDYPPFQERLEILNIRLKRLKAYIDKKKEKEKNVI